MSAERGNWTGPWPATADASWHAHGGHGSRRYHWPRTDDPARSRCSSLTALDNGPDGGGVHPPWDVPAFLRCARNGCKQEWARFDEVERHHPAPSPSRKDEDR